MEMRSFHVHGAGAVDRQLGGDDWNAVREAFCAEGRVVLDHGGGHYIPTNKQALQKLRDFLASELINGF